MRLHFVPLALDQILQPSLHGLERVVDDLSQRLVHLVLSLLLVGDQLMPRRHSHVYAHAEWITLAL